MQNCVRKKRPKKTSGGPYGDPIWNPKWPKIDVGDAKNANISWKCFLLAVRFLTVFSTTEKPGKSSKKKRPGPQGPARGVPKSPGPRSRILS